VVTERAFLAGQGVRVHGVPAGPVGTDMTRSPAYRKLAKKLLRNVSEPRFVPSHENYIVACRANCRATASPIPLEAPVTSALPVLVCVELEAVTLKEERRFNLNRIKIGRIYCCCKHGLACRASNNLIDYLVTLY
jgi:hypothetical protein